MQEDFEMLALAVISEIPSGKVASYSQIAALMGYPRHARHVGKACAHSHIYGEAPCHRVVSSQGKLCPGWSQQRQLLEAEGVTFKANGCVDMKRNQWEQR